MLISHNGVYVRYFGVFCHVTTFELVNSYLFFGGASCLVLQGLGSPSPLELLFRNIHICVQFGKAS